MLLPFVLWSLELVAIGALTFFVLAEAYRILQYARTIRHLAQRALPAAQGVAGYTAALALLRDLEDPASRLSRAAPALEDASAALAVRLSRAHPEDAR
ncbi:MAG TPA: hypothetical protein VFX49_05605 [Chloroflexota bacterium]|nr:hypothetical protein [Chloroflexota bacterium]